MPVCPIHREFSFIDKCRVNTCMYHVGGGRCVSACLLLGRKEADGGSISDEEIAFYKGLSMQKFESERSKALKRARRLLLLRKYVEFLRELSIDETRRHTEAGAIVHRRLCRHRPTSFPELQLTVSLTQLLLDPKRYADFRIKVAKRLKLHGGDEKIPSQHRLLGLTRIQLKRYWRQINEQRNKEV